jgi:hypothetical protein
VPGSANYPLGKIELNLCFGDHHNFQREKLEFEVMDWPSQYHATLGRPVFARGDVEDIWCNILEFHTTKPRRMPKARNTPVPNSDGGRRIEEL